jgi:hypothetical protein
VARKLQVLELVQCSNSATNRTEPQSTYENQLLSEAIISVDFLRTLRHHSQLAARAMCPPAPLRPLHTSCMVGESCCGLPEAKQLHMQHALLLESSEAALAS